MSLRAEPLRLTKGWSGWSISVSGFPLQEASRVRIGAVLRSLAIASLTEQPSALGTFLLTDQLHRDGASRLLSQHVKRWKPELGLAIYPERERPRESTEEDYTEVEHDAEPVETAHQVLRVGRTDDEALHAWEAFWGTGTTTLVIADNPIDEMLAAMSVHARSGIADPAFRSFSLYIPQFSLTFLAGDLTADEMRVWLPGVRLYVRESEEDGAVLVIAAEELRPTVDAAIRAAEDN